MTDREPSTRAAGAGRAVRVAVDLLGGDGAPEVVVDAALRALDADPALSIVLVGPPDAARDLLAARGVPLPEAGHGHAMSGHRVQTAAAATVVGMDDDPLRAVRARRDLTVRVCYDLVASGRADATVSAGHSGAAVVAASFVLGRLRGITRPALAVVLPALAGPVVLLDAGAGTTATPDLLAQHALLGAAYAEALGTTDPRVGLLTIGSEPGKGDAVRAEADALLAELPVRYAGPVEGHDVALGGAADVVVTDGFTGNVALKAVEGTLAWAVEAFGRAYGDPGPARAALREVAHGRYAGGMLLGVDGVSVVGHGASTAASLAAAVELASTAVRRDLVARTGALVEGLVARRRAAAGLA